MTPATTKASEVRSGLDGLVAEWIDGLRSANTRAAYERDLRAFADWCTTRGRSPLSATQGDVSDYSAACTAGGASAATVARRLAAVASFYRHALGADAVTQNPTTEVERPGTSERRGEAVLDTGESSALIEAAASLGPKVEVLVDLLLLDGLKLGEALALDVSDVARGAGEAAATVTRRGAHQHVPLDERTVWAIRAYLGRRRTGPLLLGSSPARTEPGRLTRFGADFLVKQAGRRAGIEKQLSASLLRSSYIAAAHRGGTAIEDIRHHVGHRHARDTRRYVGPSRP